MSTARALKSGVAAPAVGRAHLSLTSLQYLRAVAALLVVYFHAVLQLKNLGISAPALPLIGESGVDLFFVLSGFLMWITTARSSTTPLSFLRKRLIRIMPLYWALTLAAAAVALLAPQLLKSTVLEGGHFMASMLFVAAENPAYVEGMGDNLRFAPVLIPGWTLNYEMFFYAIFALCMLTKPKRRLILVPVVFALLSLAGISNQLGDGALSFYGNPIILEFVLGMGIAVLVQRGALLKPMAALVLGVVASVLLLASDLAHAPARALTVGLPAAAAVYALYCLEIGGLAKSLPVLEALGDASYSIYLTHIFSLAACRTLFLHLHPDGAVNEFAFLIVSVCVSAVVGLMTYNLYEKPAMHLLERFK